MPACWTWKHCLQRPCTNICHDDSQVSVLAISSWVCSTVWVIESCCAHRNGPDLPDWSYLQSVGWLDDWVWKSTIGREVAKKELREYLKILFPSIWSERFCWLIAPISVTFLECSFKTVAGKSNWNRYILNQAKSEFLIQTALIPRDICFQLGNRRNSMQLIRLINWISMSYLHNQSYPSSCHAADFLKWVIFKKTSQDVIPR